MSAVPDPPAHRPVCRNRPANVARSRRWQLAPSRPGSKPLPHLHNSANSFFRDAVTSGRGSWRAACGGGGAGVRGSRVVHHDTGAGGEADDDGQG